MGLLSEHGFCLLGIAAVAQPQSRCTAATGEELPGSRRALSARVLRPPASCWPRAAAPYTQRALGGSASSSLRRPSGTLIATSLSIGAIFFKMHWCSGWLPVVDAQQETAPQRHSSLFGRLSGHHPLLLTGLGIAARHDVDDHDQYNRQVPSCQTLRTQKTLRVSQTLRVWSDAARPRRRPGVKRHQVSPRDLVSLVQGPWAHSPP